uniref:CCHC-type domain-containing protein n=1 Tax=Oryzias latipes TaxID=8090 RepID=A0A3B3IIK6_ORYLA
FYISKNPDLKNILPITTAKVPIVKFYHINTSLEGDISLYNTLALHNTHLLASYAAIDRRVKILCYVMKVFAKIYFGKHKPEVLVDGWNVYFFDDLKTLPSHWPQHGKNTESIGELWLGLLRFYTEDFDFKEHVVSIRQRARLTTFSKQWTSKYIVIEGDLLAAFNLSLPHAMMVDMSFIVQQEYFFDPEVLTEGQVAPNDRCCRICGKVGHFMKDCSIRIHPYISDNELFFFYYSRSRQKRDSEERPENLDGDEPRVQFRKRNDRHKKRDPLEQRCCFLCGSAAHIKKDCQLYKNTAGSRGIDPFF